MPATVRIVWIALFGHFCVFCLVFWCFFFHRFRRCQSVALGRSVPVDSLFVIGLIIIVIIIIMITIIKADCLIIFLLSVEPSKADRRSISASNHFFVLVSFFVFSKQNMRKKQ